MNLQTDRRSGFGRLRNTSLLLTARMKERLGTYIALFVEVDRKGENIAI